MPDEGGLKSGQDKAKVHQLGNSRGKKIYSVVEVGKLVGLLQSDLGDHRPEPQLLLLNFPSFRVSL